MWYFQSRNSCITEQLRNLNTQGWLEAVLGSTFFTGSQLSALGPGDIIFTGFGPLKKAQLLAPGPEEPFLEFFPGPLLSFTGSQ